MNLIGSRPDGWWNNPDKAMRKLAESLDEFAAETGDQVTVVFDKDPGALPPVDHVEVAVARRRGRNAADYEIEQIVGGDEDAASLIVVTSDRELVEKVQALGAKVTGSGSFRKRL